MNKELIQIRCEGKTVDVCNIHRGYIDQREVIIAEDMSNGELYMRVGHEKWQPLKWTTMWNEETDDYDYLP